MTRNARISHDLRTYFTPADYDEDPPADQGADPPDGEGTDPKDDATGDATLIKDPDKKRLSDEAAAHRVRAKKAEEALATATASVQDLRIENAFIRVAVALVDDLDATWK